MSAKSRIPVEWCEACGGRVDPETGGADPEGLVFCADCIEDWRNEKKSRCDDIFEGAPFKPGRPIRAFICHRAKGHDGLHAAMLLGFKEPQSAVVRWQRYTDSGTAPRQRKRD